MRRKNIDGYIVPLIREQDVIVKAENQISDIQYRLYTLNNDMKDADVQGMYTMVIDDVVKKLQEAHDELRRIVPVDKYLKWFLQQADLQAEGKPSAFDRREDI